MADGQRKLIVVETEAVVNQVFCLNSIHYRLYKVLLVNITVVRTTKCEIKSLIFYLLGTN